MIRAYEIQLGGRKYPTTLDPSMYEDWWDGPQSQCEIMVGKWFSARERHSYKRFPLPGFRLEHAGVGIVRGRYTGGSVGYRDVELCQDGPDGVPLPPPQDGLHIGGAAGGGNHYIEWNDLNWRPFPADPAPVIPRQAVVEALAAAPQDQVLNEEAVAQAINRLQAYRAMNVAPQQYRWREVAVHIDRDAPPDEVQVRRE